MTKKRKKRNIVVKDDIQIGFPRNRKMCILCHNELNKVGVKFQTNNVNPWSVVRTYWVHINCLHNISSDHADNLCSDKLITTRTFGCAYCKKVDANLEMHRFHMIYLHPKCMESLRNRFQKVFAENELELSVKLI